MPERHRRYFLKEKESRYLLDRASHRFRINPEMIFRDKSQVEAVETEFGVIVLIKGNPSLVKIGEEIIPALTFKEFIDRAPKAVVDMGAVPYICKGANVMAPGIRHFHGDFKKGDLVFIVDEKHCKVIALGEALFDAEEAKNVRRGMVIKNLHFVGDRIWNALRDLIRKD